MSADNPRSHDHKPKDKASLPLTFGIELELLFLCDQEKVRGKWHFLSPDNFVEEDGDYVDPNPYADQPLKQAALLFRESNLAIRAVSDPKGLQEHDKWVITREDHADWSKIQQRVDDTDNKLKEWTDGRVSDLSVHKWDPTGLELVSRVLPVSTYGKRVSPDGLNEVRGYIDLLETGPAKPYIFLSEVEIGGLHVHVGLDPTWSNGTGLPTKVLQHLAYLCILYEDIISTFHHPQRRGYPGTKTEHVANSNRFGVSAQRHTCGELTRLARQNARSAIFKQDMSPNQLAELMDQKPEASSPTGDPDPADRMRFVNFENTKSYNPKKTVEFRQHHGTLSFAQLREWVIFVVGLVRAAERMALEAETPSPSPITAARLSHLGPALHWGLGQEAKYATIFRRQEDRMHQLFEILALPRCHARYWWDRAREFRRDRYTDFPTYRQCRECVATAATVAAAAEGGEAEAEVEVVQVQVGLEEDPFESVPALRDEENPFPERKRRVGRRRVSMRMRSGITGTGSRSASASATASGGESRNSRTTRRTRTV